MDISRNTHSYTRIHTHTHAHTYAHTHINTQTKALSHTYTYTNACAFPLQLLTRKDQPLEPNSAGGTAAKGQKDTGAAAKLKGACRNGVKSTQGPCSLEQIMDAHIISAPDRYVILPV
jgi:hypothetical protein